ncbi:tetratricopeptide repeat protein [Nocardiopsis sp. RSe5-2]|uniref:Tetratricopeptide repeat protein n=1 Tax=Nocardiopsis endophytica TaxID=3018445 RepID=A0ABT4U8F7_9ACTN|nr:tetratricopeptide repeat protein [Nocardiopsis endophytica]MDA2813233.1 tetratricopeptide repeat protein [Nocardiopsis endophytica]
MSTDLFGVRVLDLDPERRRVRFRVFVTYYEPSWGTGDLLPDHPTFFCRLLWEAAERFTPHRFGPMTDVVTIDEFLDEWWVECNTHRFVVGVERVAERNHPVDDDDFDRLAMFYYERDGGWQDEERLAQADYDVHVTDARWIESLRIGQSWGTTSYSGGVDGLGNDGVDWAEWERECAERADDDPHALFVLGWLRQERGDTEGAAEAFRRLAEASDRRLHAKALLYLGALHEAQGDDETACELYRKAERSRSHQRYAQRYRSRAALRLGALLRRLGREEEARAAFARAAAKGEEDNDRGVLVEVRRLTGAESPAEAADRLRARGDREGAAAVIAEHYGAAVVELAERMLAGDTEAAGAAVGALDGAHRVTAAAVLIDIAMTWAQERDSDAAVAKAVELAVATGRVVEGYRGVVDRDGFVAATGSDRAAERLLTVLSDADDEEAAVALATAAVRAHPSVARKGLIKAGRAAGERGDHAAAVRLFGLGAGFEGTDEEARAVCRYDLGIALRELGEVEQAREAFAQAESGFTIWENAGRAARQRAEAAHAQGDSTAAYEDWVRAAVHKTRADHDGRTVDRAVRLLADLLGEVGAEALARYVMAAVRQMGDQEFQDAVEACTDAKAEGDQLYAVFHFAHWVLEAEGDDGELGKALLERTAEGLGEFAAGAAVTLGARAHYGGDNATAREWWRRALEKGNKKMAHKAVTNLGLVAKLEHDLPQLLEHYGPVVESGHEDGPLFSAHIGELQYWLEDWDEAVRWYRRTLDGTDDPELVGEAAYRVGEILLDGEEHETALACLRRAADTGYAPFAGQAQELLSRKE